MERNFIYSGIYVRGLNERITEVSAIDRFLGFRSAAVGSSCSQALAQFHICRDHVRTCIYIFTTVPYLKKEDQLAK